MQICENKVGTVYESLYFAGGFGTRLSEETGVKPRPMVEIGGYPMLWHVMKGYATFGFKEFVIGLGYKGEIIKDYFVNYKLRIKISQLPWQQVKLLFTMVKF